MDLKKRSDDETASTQNRTAYSGTVNKLTLKM